MTRSTFSGFTIAHLAMNASQRALDVTGQNIANINTRGYTRQQVDLMSLNLRNGDQVGPGPGTKIGYGVEVTGISQIRDPFLDIQYRNQIDKVGTADAHQATLDQLANIFDEVDKDALETALSNLRSSLDELSKDPNNSEYDSIVRSRCQVILNYIHQKADDLKHVREDTIYSLENADIPTVNNLLSDIGQLNDAIWKSQVMGNPALELQDERNTKLDELASYLPISVTYKDVYISTGAKFDYPVVKFQGSDGVSYNLTAGEHGENFGRISMERNLDKSGEQDGTVSISLVPASDYTVALDNSPMKTDITDYLKDGTLKGTVDMLNKSGELDAPVTDYRGLGYYEKSFDAFVQTFAKTLNELNTNTIPYTGVEDLPPTGKPSSTTVAGDEFATYTFNCSGITDNFLNAENIKINGQNYFFTDGTATGNQIAIGATFEDTMRDLAQRLNADAPSMEVNGTSVAGTWTFAGGNLTWTANSKLPAGETIIDGSIKDANSNDIKIDYTGNPGNIKNYDLFKTSDGSRVFTAENIKISDDWMNNSIHIIGSHEKDAGSTDNSNILKIIDELKAERKFTYEYTYTDDNGNVINGSVNFFKGSFQQCYENLQGTQGIDSSANKAILSNHISVLKQTANNRDAVSGVNLDEEGINLMQYQRSYTAAARLMTTLDEALDVLINNTGIVGR